MVPVSCPVQKPQHEPRRSWSRCLLNTRASSMMQALPAALSVAGRAGPGVLVAADHDEILGPAPAISPVVICTGRQPFSTLVRSHTRTGPRFGISLSFSPAVRAMPMQGSVGISVS